MIKARVFFYDAVDYSTGEFLSLQDAYREGYLEFDGDTLSGTDDCTIINLSTGLLDKNGKQIFEGDIVVYDSNTETYQGESGTAKVDKSLGSNNLAFWWITQKTRKPTMFSEVSYFGCAKELEVIGNIYQNPELLESKNG